MSFVTQQRPAVRLKGGLFIPPTTGSLEGFRSWTVSEGFPERGRIDYLDGTIEVDMSPEELQTHGILKMELSSFLHEFVKKNRLGQVFVDRARLCSKEANLSCEPDVLFVSLKALKNGQVRYAEKKSQAGRYIEVVGAADLAVEVISDGSVGKDRKRLPPLYAKAGVRELWLVDARGAELKFQIWLLRASAYAPAQTDSEGFQVSEILGLQLRLRREPWDLPHTWEYFVDERPLTTPEPGE